MFSAENIEFETLGGELSAKESELHRVVFDQAQFHTGPHPIRPTDLHPIRQFGGISLPETAKAVPAVALLGEVEKNDRAQRPSTCRPICQGPDRLEALLIGEVAASAHDPVDQVRGSTGVSLHPRIVVGLDAQSVNLGKVLQQVCVNGSQVSGPAKRGAATSDSEGRTAGLVMGGSDRFEVDSAHGGECVFERAKQVGWDALALRFREVGGGDMNRGSSALEGAGPAGAYVVGIRVGQHDPVDAGPFESDLSHSFRDGSWPEACIQKQVVLGLGGPAGQQRGIATARGTQYLKGDRQRRILARGT